MPVIGFALKNLKIQRGKGDVKERVDIDSTPKITAVNERKLEFLGKQLALIVDFEFLTLYKPDFGEIKITGEVTYSTEEDVKKLVKDWEKKKELPQIIDADIKNFLFRKCLTLGVNLSADFQLPPPMGFPVVRPKER